MQSEMQTPTGLADFWWNIFFPVVYGKFKQLGPIPTYSAVLSTVPPNKTG